MSKKCVNCGAEIEDDALFCDECGAEQVIKRDDSNNTKIEIDTKPNDDVKKTQNKESGLAIASLVLGIISICSLGVFYIPEILAIVLGVKSQKKFKSKPASIGIALGIISLVITIILMIFGNNVSFSNNKTEHSSEVASCETTASAAEDNNDISLDDKVEEHDEATATSSVNTEDEPKTEIDASLEEVKIEETAYVTSLEYFDQLINDQGISIDGWKKLYKEYEKLVDSDLEYHYLKYNPALFVGDGDFSEVSEDEITSDDDLEHMIYIGKLKKGKPDGFGMALREESYSLDVCIGENNDKFYEDEIDEEDYLTERPHIKMALDDYRLRMQQYSENNDIKDVKKNMVDWRRNREFLSSRFTFTPPITYYADSQFKKDCVFMEIAGYDGIILPYAEYVGYFKDGKEDHTKLYLRNTQRDRINSNSIEDELVMDCGDNLERFSIKYGFSHFSLYKDNTPLISMCTKEMYNDDIGMNVREVDLY